MNPKTKQEKTINLLNQLIQEAERQDLEYKQAKIQAHEADKAFGESWMLFHLKTLRELLSSEA